MKQGKSAALILRVSTHIQSYDRQLTDLTALAKSMGYSVDKKHIYHEKISGLKKKDERLELIRLLNDIRQGIKINMVFATEISRISRQPLIGHQFIQELFDLGVPVYIQNMKNSSMNTDGSRNSMFFLIMGILLEFAKTEAEYTKQRMASGKLHNFKEGRHMGGEHIPFGYDVASRIEGDRKAGKLIINEDQAKVVRMVFDMYINQQTGMKILANHLNDLKIPTRTGVDWSTSTINQMLKNELYYGSRNYKGVIYEGIVPAIISKGIYQQALDASDKRDVRPARNVKFLYLLRGKCHCGYCGNAYVPKFSTGARHKVSNKLYHCSTRQNGGTCMGAGIGLDKLESVVWSLVIRNNGVLDYLKNNNRTTFQTQKDIQGLELNIKSLQYDITKKNEELVNCKRLFKMGRSSEQELKDDMDRIEASKRNIEERLATIHEQVKVKRNWIKNYDTLNKYTDFLNEIGTDRVKINEILNVVLDKVNLTSLSDRLCNYYIITVNFTGGIKPVTVLFNKNPIGKPLEFRMEYFNNPDTTVTVKYKDNILVNNVKKLAEAFRRPHVGNVEVMKRGKKVLSTQGISVRLIPFNQINIHPDKDKPSFKKRVRKPVKLGHKKPTG